jgi:hypothetical protein
MLWIETSESGGQKLYVRRLINYPFNRNAGVQRLIVEVQRLKLYVRRLINCPFDRHAGVQRLIN